MSEPSRTRVDASQMTAAVERFGQKVDTFDEALAATMPWADAWLTRFEAAIARLEAVKEKR